MQRVGVVGAGGKMGVLAAAAIDQAPDLSLTALVAPRDVAAYEGAAHYRSIDHVEPDRVDVLVDLTVAAVARRTLAWVVGNAKDAVVGTSGLTDVDLDTVRKMDPEERSRILVVPNFSIGAALLQLFAAAAAPQFASAEVIELHHDAKRDAPSGTSIATARAIAEARAAGGLDEWVDSTEGETLAGARGALGPGGVRIHSVRLAGLLAHQELLFGSAGEGLTLRHDVYDRTSYLAGLLLAIRRLDRIVGLHVGLDHVLDAR